MTEESKELKRYKWEAMVSKVLAEHPDWMAGTINAAQRGMLAAIERQQERNTDLSMALWEALRTKPHYKRRDHEMIIKGIQASTLHPTKWSAEALEKEQAASGDHGDGAAVG
jgi:hypothetical protein